MAVIYACGGTGTNIARQINDLDVEINYIDTSKSNMRNLKSDNVFVLENIDGAGKDRSKTFEHFKDIAEDVLIRFKPSSSLNIVISSLSGGSGSVISPLITKELLSKGYNTVVIGINSKHSVKEMDNTIKTLKTFKSISNVTKKPVALYYIENDNREKADKEAIYFINTLLLLLDKQNTEELDISDVDHFLDYTKVTSNSPSVGVIEVTENTPFAVEKNTSVVGSILITTNRGTVIKEPVPEYAATCIVTDSQYKNADIRVNNVLGKFALILEDLESSIQKFHDDKRINKIKDVEVSSNNEHGIVL
jgi:hypothetical protein